VDSSVPELLSAVQPGEDWEEVLFASACAGAREWAQQFLERLDAALAQERPAGLRLKDRRWRTVVTRLGALRVRRRRYRSAQGWRYLLDEALGWAPRQALSPALRQVAVELASYVPYERSAALLGELLVEGPGASTVRRAVLRVGGALAAAAAAQHTAVYTQGQAPPSGPQVARTLFVEADGVFIALQRAPERRAELKAAIAYPGTRPCGRDRHGQVRRALVNKEHYADLAAGETFWEGAWLQFAARWDLSQTAQVVLGGDGAAWIRGGLPDGAQDQFQLDRFHLARALRRRLGRAGREAFTALRQGDRTPLEQQLAVAHATAGGRRERQERLRQLEHYLAANADGLTDWTVAAPTPPASPVRLGAMEANIDKPYAQRFKRRGMSWSGPGARALAKVLQARANGALTAACREAPQPSAARRRAASAATTRSAAGARTAPPFQARFAPRWGPHASRPWVQALRRLLS